MVNFPPFLIQISFLMRMIELIGKHPPINVLMTTTSEMTSLETSLYVDEDDAEIDGNNVDEEEAMTRMKIICQCAREVLLSHVKKDINLTLYPGSIQFPGGLYSRPRPTSPLTAHAKVDLEGSITTKSKKPKKSISYYVKKSQDETSVSKSEYSFEDDDPEDVERSVENCPEEQATLKSDHSFEEDNLEDEEHSIEENKLEIETKSEDDDVPNVDFSGDTYNPSFSFSPPPSPRSHDNGDFDRNLGDVSPISKTTSPTINVASKCGKSRSSSARRKKSTTIERKRKMKEVNVYDEFPSPAEPNGTQEEGRPPSPASPAKKRKSTPKSGSSKKSKATPVSVPKSVLINVTNSTISARSGFASAPRAASASKKKKRSSKKEIVASVEEETDDDFDFSDSPAKAKTKTAHSRKKTALTVPASVKGKAPTAKAVAAAGSKKSIRNVYASLSSSSPSTTTEASSRVSPVYRPGRRKGARSSRD